MADECKLKEDASERADKVCVARHGCCKWCDCVPGV